MKENGKTDMTGMTAESVTKDMKDTKEKNYTKGKNEMKEKAKSIRQLKEELGQSYVIRYVDFEKCLYRDFGNGFNVEISGVDNRRLYGKVNLYLWYGTEETGCHLVNRIMQVPRNAGEIDRATNVLLEYSNLLFENGYRTRNSDEITEIVHHGLAQSGRKDILDKLDRKDFLES